MQNFEYEEKQNDAVECRCIVDNTQVGGIIGKGGANVKKLRDETNVFVNILKCQFRSVTDRVMIIKGSIPNLARAVSEVSRLMIESANAEKSTHKDGQDGNNKTIAFRILAHKISVGAVIGKGGQSIKDIQTESECKIQIANEVLPLSTEKVITITGTAEGLERASYRILSLMHENPVRSDVRVVHYVPGVFNNSYMGPISGNMNGYQGQSSQGGNRGGNNGGFTGPLSGAFSSITGLPSSLSLPLQFQQTQTNKLKIPSHTAGSVLGKGGVIMRDLRAKTGCSISIADAEAATPDERVVTITGSQQGLMSAEYLIRHLVESYMPPSQNNRVNNKGRGSGNDRNRNRNNRENNDNVPSINSNAGQVQF